MKADAMTKTNCTNQQRRLLLHHNVNMLSAEICNELLEEEGEMGSVSIFLTWAP
jgi:hypothetical protein